MLDELTKDFSEERLKRIDKEVEHYRLLMKLRGARKKSGMTQEELAKKAKINRTTLSKIESGLRNATIGTLDKLVSALDMKLDIQFHALG